MNRAGKKPKIKRGTCSVWRKKLLLAGICLCVGWNLSGKEVFAAAEQEEQKGEEELSEKQQEAQENF